MALDKSPSPGGKRHDLSGKYQTTVTFNNKRCTQTSSLELEHHPFLAFLEWITCFLTLKLILAKRYFRCVLCWRYYKTNLRHLYVWQFDSYDRKHPGGNGTIHFYSTHKNYQWFEEKQVTNFRPKVKNRITLIISIFFNM